MNSLISGDIRVASSYADQSKFVTNTGHISLKNIHNESYIASYESGNVKVRGLDGSTNIFVKKGDVELHISKINQESRILVEDGDITVKMIDTHPVKITIDANQIIPGRCNFTGKNYFFKILNFYKMMMMIIGI